MRRMIFGSIVLAMALFIGGLAQAETWSTDDGDFTTKFWVEIFKGGGPGQPGNELKALGQGYIFRKAVLQSTYFDDATGRWITTYVDGKLNLNSKGPWLLNKNLKASGITAMNSSAFDPATGHLDFVLTFSGEFDNRPGVLFQVEARYSGIPEIKVDPESGYQFQTDDDYSVDITITGLPVPLRPGLRR